MFSNWLSRKLKKKPSSAAFANFYAVNIPSKATVKLPIV